MATGEELHRRYGCRVLAEGHKAEPGALLEHLDLEGEQSAAKEKGKCNTIWTISRFEPIRADSRSIYAIAESSLSSSPVNPRDGSKLHSPATSIRWSTPALLALRSSDPVAISAPSGEKATAEMSK